MYTVYKLTSPSGRVYIGFTKNSLNVRWSGHKSNWKIWQNSNKQRQASCTKLFYAFNKYHPDTWTKEVVFTSENKDAALAVEIEQITQCNSVEDGYNLSTGGECGASGATRSPEDRKKRSESRKRYYESEEGKLWLAKLAEINRSRPKKLKPVKQRFKGTEEHRRQCSERMTQIQANEKERGIRRNYRDFQPESQKIAVSKKNSATWLITYPNGRQETTSHLRQWAIDNGLHPTYTSNNFSGVGTYKGYKAIKISDPHHVNRHTKENKEKGR